MDKQLEGSASLHAEAVEDEEGLPSPKRQKLEGEEGAGVSGVF